jgi:hypothetical protein
LAALPDWMSEAVTDASDDQLSARPAGGRWCVKEHLEHLIDVEVRVSRSVSATLAEDTPSIANRDDEAENSKITESGACRAPIESLLSRLREGRAKLVALVEDVPRSEWGRSGQHELYGPISVFQMLRHVVWHDHNHLESVQRLLNS